MSSDRTKFDYTNVKPTQLKLSNYFCWPTK